MGARKASCSSESLACNESLVLPYSRPCGRRVSETTPVSAYVSNMDGFGVPDTSAPLGCKSGSINSDHSYVWKDNAVMHSCWIRRLNPACRSSYLEEKESREPTHVRTHFTKHFHSFSTRLEKEQHHTRSLSWPPNERTSKLLSQASKTQAPVDIREQHYLLSRATSPNFREENLRVPHQDALESNDSCSKTKNSSQKSGFSLEAVVPCSHAATAWDDDEGHHVTNSATRHLRWLAKDDGFAADDFNSNFRCDSGSYQDVGFGRVLGKAFNEGKFASSNLAQRMVHSRGCRSDAASWLSFSSVCSGASADADDSPTKYVFPSTPFNLSINSQAEVLADIGKEINEEQLEASHKKNIGQGCSKDRKSGRNFGFLHSVGRSKTLDQSMASPCDCHGVCNGGCVAKCGICNRDSTVPASFKSSQMKQSVGFDTAATNGGSSKPLRSLNKDYRRGKFSATREEDHCLKLLEDSATVDLSDPSYSIVTPPQEHIMDAYRMCRLDQATNVWKPDERNKLHSFAHPSRQMPVNHPFVKPHHSWNVPAGFRHKHSTVRKPSEESFILRTLQGESVQVEMRRLVSQANLNEQLHKFSDDEGWTANRPSQWLKQAWIRRWCSSSSSVMATPGGTLLPPCARRNKELEIGFLTETPIMTSKLHMEDPAARKRYHDVSRGADIPRSTSPVYGRHTSVRGKYMPPSVEAMTIVDNTASKLHRTSMKRSDSFLVWSSPSEENSQEGEPSMHTKGIIEGTSQGEDLNDLDFFGRNVW